MATTTSQTMVTRIPFIRRLQSSSFDGTLWQLARLISP
ncbi:unnamed protein product [Acidithrix sp. C25]|nr:unnamed protein product [Acidithrix sp. C25]